jgi:hypothetical protein
MTKLRTDTRAAENITAKIIADSVNPDGIRLTTFLLTYPRFIHSELMTHRVLSRNSSSSRAIPILAVMKAVWHNPAMPVYWGSRKKGMQAGEELTGVRLWLAEKMWRWARLPALAVAGMAHLLGLHKQVANRLLEPWTYMTTLVSATEWVNFFRLRTFGAQPEFMLLARKMLAAYMQRTPRKLVWGEWHFPDPEFECQLMAAAGQLEAALDLAAAKAARTSYTAFHKELDAKTAQRIHNQMADERHMSPFEHTARAVAHDKDCGNFKGWKQYRKDFTGEAGDENPGATLDRLWEQVKAEHPELVERITLVEEDEA